MKFFISATSLNFKQNSLKLLVALFISEVEYQQQQLNEYQRQQKKQFVYAKIEHSPFTTSWVSF